MANTPVFNRISKAGNGYVIYERTIDSRFSSAVVSLYELVCYSNNAIAYRDTFANIMDAFKRGGPYLK